MGCKYFAYGSNVALDVMMSRCHGCRDLGVAELRDHRLAFTRRSVRSGTGVADVVPADGMSVWGALYEVSEADLAILDRKEGEGWAYRRVSMPVRVREDGSEHDAFVYTVIDKEPTEVPPSDEYLSGVVRAARRRELPEEYVREIESIRERAADDRGVDGTIESG
jgi:gamma-glutamylcyclotransferase